MADKMSIGNGSDEIKYSIVMFILALLIAAGIILLMYLYYKRRVRSLKKTISRVQNNNDGVQNTGTNCVLLPYNF